jgi:multidrug efflux pump subunit AcrA (membrane-fusion protein)
MIAMVRTQRSLLAAGGVAVALAAAGCGERGRVAAAREQAPVPVKIATVARGDVADTFEAGGVVQGRTTALLTARVLAPVREVRVSPGDRVRAGQALIVLDGSDLIAQARGARAAADVAEHDVLAADADQQAAEAALVLARAAHGRIAALHAKRSATAQELDEATAALRSAEANAAAAGARARSARSGVARARATAEASATTASFASITAPFDGVVTEKLVEPGNMALPGSPLLRVEDTRAFRLEVRVDESRVSQIAIGDPVRVVLDALPEAARVVEGRVTEISRAVDADARAFLVKIDLATSAAARSGTFGRAMFRAEPRQALTVPSEALTRRGQLTSVFVVDEGTARLRLVNVAGTEVLAGLSAGERAIVSPPPGIADGSRVTPGGDR